MRSRIEASIVFDERLGSSIPDDLQLCRNWS